MALFLGEGPGVGIRGVPTDSHEKWISRSRFFFFQFKEFMAKGAEQLV